VRAAVEEDPDGVIATADGTVFIDEWQELPETLGSVKRAVDQLDGGEAGRFLITGSVRARKQAATWPGTGRFIRVRMYGLTQAELERDARYNPIDAFFDHTPPRFGHSDVTRGDYLERVTAGRFPAAVGLAGRNRSRWYSAYIEQLIDRDAEQVSERTTQAAKLRAVFLSCVARTGQELNRKATARDADVDFRTAEYYIGLLEDLSVIAHLPAWHSKRLKRLTQTPKVHVVDPGMACHVLNVDAATLGGDAALVGQIFETFVAAELLTYVETALEETSVFHFRDRDGHEVDIVLEQRGRVVALEVKSATAVDRSDVKGLIWLRNKLADDFHYGAVLYSGQIPFEIDDRIWALPISSLWRVPQ
jgi:predicted AAA+ superfamily ATPase